MVAITNPSATSAPRTAPQSYQYTAKESKTCHYSYRVVWATEISVRLLQQCNIQYTKQKRKYIKIVQ